MIVEFIATETGTEHTEHYIATGVARSDPPHYLMFSRSLPIGDDEDWGIEIEFDDQINSGYEKIKSCLVRFVCISSRSKSLSVNNKYKFI